MMTEMALSQEILSRSEKVLFRYGLATVLSLGLVGFLALVVWQEMQSIHGDVRDINQLLLLHERENYYLLRGICFGVHADNVAAKEACNPPMNVIQDISR